MPRTHRSRRATHTLSDQADARLALLQAKEALRQQAVRERELAYQIATGRLDVTRQICAFFALDDAFCKLLCFDFIRAMNAEQLDRYIGEAMPRFRDMEQQEGRTPAWRLLGSVLTYALTRYKLTR